MFYIFLVGAILLIVLAILAIRGTVRSGAARQYRVPFRQPRSDAVSFVGGCMWPGSGTMRASVPLMRLEIFEEGFRLGPSARLLAALIPSVQIPKRDVLTVSTVQGSGLRPTRAHIETSGGDTVDFFGPTLASVYDVMDRMWGARSAGQP